MNRKMFKKSRPARSALNQAGGIMDSSPELMQTVQNYPVPGVQNFANGTEVRIPGPYFSRIKGQRPRDEGKPTYPVYRQGGGGFLSMKPSRQIYNKAYPGPEYAADLIRSQQFGEGGRKLIDRIAGYPGALVAKTSGGITDLIGAGQSILGFDDAAVRSDKRADKYYNNALDMLLGQGISLTQPEYGTSDAEQQFLQDASVKDASSSKFDASLPFGGEFTPAELAERQARFDAQDDERALNIFENRGRQLLPDPDKKAFADKAIEDKAALLNRERALYGPSVDPSGMNDYLAKIQAETEAEKFERLRRTAAPATKEAIAAEEARLAADSKAGSDQFETSRRAIVDSSGIQGEKEVTDVIQKGTPQDRQRSLGELMAEFTDNAPKYEGMSKGLAIAKIGFAIAAGDSPNAMTNIAKGLSQGADEFIKDKANRDAFDRQLKLSALQYGLGEKSKIDAQSRADRRDLQQMVVGTKGLTINGEYFGPGENVTLSTEQMLSLPPKTLAGISTVEAYNDRLEAFESLIKEQKDKGIKHSEWGAVEERYTDSLSSAKEAEIAKTYINNALITVSEKDGQNITSLTAAGKQIFGSTLTALGISRGKEYQKLDEFERDLALGLNKIIPLVIGDTQSANSISDRDVGFVIKAFLASGVIDQKGKNGAFRYVGDNPQAIANGLQAALESINTSQKEDLAQMTQIEKNYGDVVVRGMNSKTGGQLLENPIATKQKFFGTEQGIVWDPTANQGKGGLRLRKAT